MGPELQLCPDWLTEPNPERRALLLLAEMAHGYGAANLAMGMNLAKMAQELFLDLGADAPSLRQILGLSPLGDFPTLSEPPTTREA